MTEHDVPQTPVRQEVMDRAAKYLAYRPRTRQELCRHLQEKGVDTEEANRCADWMEEYHLVDDLEFSRLYIETMLQRGRGMERIRRELRQKGISELMIEDAQLLLEEIPDEYETALQQAIETLQGVDVQSMDHREREKQKGRIARRLAGRGFRTETIYRAVREAFEQRRQQQSEE